MKKGSTAAVQQMNNFQVQTLTIGLDLGDRSNLHCVLYEAGSVLLEQRLSTTPKGMKEVFGVMLRSRFAREHRDAFAVGEPAAGASWGMK